MSVYKTFKRAVEVVKEQGTDKPVYSLRIVNTANPNDYRESGTTRDAYLANAWALDA